MPRVVKTRTEIVQARVDAQLKAAALANLERLGLSLSEFIRLKMAELAQGTDSLFPNEKTRSAIKRLNEGEGEQFASSDEMFAHLDSLK